MGKQTGELTGSKNSIWNILTSLKKKKNNKNPDLQVSKTINYYSSLPFKMFSHSFSFLGRKKVPK